MLLAGITARSLKDLARALDDGTVPLASPRFALQRLGLASGAVDAAAQWLQSLVQEGFSARQIARVAAALGDERARTEHARDDIELVWTGPEAVGSENRDTARVLEGLFRAATSSVLIAGFAFRPGVHFDALAEAQRAAPTLRVSVFAHVFIEASEVLADALSAHDRSLRQAFAKVDRERVRFHRPSTELIELARTRGFHLHAKCVVVDARKVLITSANFTESAQERNIEVGVVLDDPRLAERLIAHFDALVLRGDMTPHKL